MSSSRVLVIDSDPSSLGLLTHSMNRLGMETDGASDAAHAIAFLKENRPDVVVSDVEPNGGLRVLEMLREDPRTSDVPVLLLGKGPWARRRAQARELGAQELVSKPAFVQDIAVLTWLYAGHSATEQLFEGTFGEPSCAALLRGLLAGGRSGTLRLDPSDAVVCFSEGMVIDCSLGNLRGERALLRILTLGTGSYELTFGRIMQTATMQFDLTDLQTRGLAHVRMWDQIKKELEPMSQVLTVDFPNLSTRAPELPRGLYPLIRLFDGKRTIRQAIEASNLDDLTAGQAIAKLRALHVFEQSAEEKWEATTPSLGRPTPDFSAYAYGANDPTHELPPLATEEALAALQLTHEMALIQAEAASAAFLDIERSFFDATAEAHVAEAHAAGHFAVRKPLIPMISPLISRDLSPVRMAGWALVGICLMAAVVLFWRSTPTGEGAPVVAQIAPGAAIGAAPGVSAPVLKPAASPLSPEAKQFDKLMGQGAVAYDKEDFKTALAAFEAAQAVDPKAGSAALAVGSSRYELGKLDTAATALNNAILLDPTNGRAEILLGAIAEEKGDKQLAKDHYQSYLSIDPDGEHAAEVKALIDNLER